jgi:hypothetical protein
MGEWMGRGTGPVHKILLAPASTYILTHSHTHTLSHTLNSPAARCMLPAARSPQPVAFAPIRPHVSNFPSIALLSEAVLSSSKEAGDSPRDIATKNDRQISPGAPKDPHHVPRGLRLEAPCAKPRVLLRHSLALRYALSIPLSAQRVKGEPGHQHATDRSGTNHVSAVVHCAFAFPTSAPRHEGTSAQPSLSSLQHEQVRAKGGLRERDLTPAARVDHSERR